MDTMGAEIITTPPNKTARDVKKIVNNRHTKELAFKTAQKERSQSAELFRDTFESLIDETLFVAGNVVKTRYIDEWTDVQGVAIPKYIYRSSGMIANPYLGVQRPAPVVVADNPFSAFGESVALRPDVWSPEESSLPDLVFEIPGLQVFATQTELEAAQRRFDRLHPTVPQA